LAWEHCTVSAIDSLAVGATDSSLTAGSITDQQEDEEIANRQSKGESYRQGTLHNGTPPAPCLTTHVTYAERHLHCWELPWKVAVCVALVPVPAITRPHCGRKNALKRRLCLLLACCQVATAFGIVFAMLVAALLLGEGRPATATTQLAGRMMTTIAAAGLLPMAWAEPSSSTSAMVR
jgi:hypothetical protein